MDELASILEIGAASAELQTGNSGVVCAISNYSKYVLLLDDVGTVASKIDTSSGHGSCSTRIVLPGAVNHHVIAVEGDGKFVFRFAVWDVPAIHEQLTFRAKNRFIEERLQYAKDDDFTYVINGDNLSVPGCTHLRDLYIMLHHSGSGGHAINAVELPARYTHGNGAQSLHKTVAQSAPDTITAGYRIRVSGDCAMTQDPTSHLRGRMRIGPGASAKAIVTLFNA